MTDVRRSGRYKKFGHSIDGGSRGEHDSFTICRECRTPLWKDMVMDTIHCPECGLELDSHYEDVGRTVRERNNPTLEGGKDVLHRYDRSTLKDGEAVTYCSPHFEYEHTRVPQMYGGYHRAYDGDGDYEFESLEDGILDSVI